MVPGVMDLTPWRVFLLVCALPSLLSGLWSLRLPESPKFLMSQGRQEEALRVFQGIYAANTGNAPETYPVKCLDVTFPVKTVDSHGHETRRFGRALQQFAPLFRKPYLSRILTVVAIQFSLMICINSLRLWTPQLLALLEQYELATDWPSKPEASTACQMISAALARQGGPVALNGTLASDTAIADGPTSCNSAVSADVFMRSVIIGSVGTSSFLISGWASKKFGNRPLLLLSFPMSAIAALAMLWAVDSDMFMGLVAVFTPTTAIGLTALSAMTVDLFPTTLRGVSVSITIICGRVGSLSGNMVLPILLNISCEALFIFISASLAVCSGLVWLIPRKGKDEDN